MQAAGDLSLLLIRVFCKVSRLVAAAAVAGGERVSCVGANLASPSQRAAADHGAAGTPGGYLMQRGHSSDKDSPLPTISSQKTAITRNSCQIGKNQQCSLIPTLTRP